MAPYLSGKLAIGKLDCTDSQTKPICEQQSVRGYPTLKIYSDGVFFDYPGKRDADSMIEFAEKMSRPAVSLVATPQDVLNVLNKGVNGNANGKENDADAITKEPKIDVAFVVYDPKAKPDTKNDTKGGEELTLVEKYLASTTATQVFGQVARKVQDRGHFFMLKPDQDKNDLALLLGLKGKGPFIAKVEMNVDPVVYKGNMNSMDVLDFVKENNVALVSELQVHNFRLVAGMGKPMLIGVVDSSDERREEMNEFTLGLRNYAKGGDAKEEYRFATMDGTKWSNFLQQFEIASNALPQLLVLDTASRMYYHNETIVSVEELVKGIKDGTIEKQEQTTGTNQGKVGVMEKFHRFFVKYMPYSMIVVVLFIGGLVYFLLSDDEDEIRYRKLVKAQQERKRKNKEKPKEKTIKED